MPVLKVKTEEGVWETISGNAQSDLPEVTTEDAGKFLRVSEGGLWVAMTVCSAEEVGF